MTDGCPECGTDIQFIDCPDCSEHDCPIRTEMDDGSLMITRAWCASCNGSGSVDGCPECGWHDEEYSFDPD